jgi:hypothetical protein
VHRTIVIHAAAVRHPIPVVRMGAEVVPLDCVVPSVVPRTDALGRLRRLLGVPAGGLLPVPSFRHHCRNGLGTKGEGHMCSNPCARVHCDGRAIRSNVTHGQHRQHPNGQTYDGGVLVTTLFHPIHKVRCTLPVATVVVFTSNPAITETGYLRPAQSLSTNVRRPSCPVPSVREW